MSAEIQNSFFDLVKARSSIRSYSSRTVDRDIINGIIESARYAPSACNRQPWRFIVVDDQEKIQSMCEKGLHQPVPNTWAQTAPVIIVMGLAVSPVVDTAGKLLKSIDYRLIDAGIAGEHICLAAQEQGLGTCWIGWFKSGAVRKICSIPRRIKIVSLITLGYAEESGSGTKQEKARKAMSEICFYNRYGDSL